MPVNILTNKRASPADPFRGAFAITPSDSVDLAIVTRGLYIGGAGDLSVVMENGDEVTFVGLAAGYHPLAVQRVNDTSTTATNIIGGY